MPLNRRGLLTALAAGLAQQALPQAEAIHSIANILVAPNPFNETQEELINRAVDRILSHHDAGPASSDKEVTVNEYLLRAFDSVVRDEEPDEYFDSRIPLFQSYNELRGELANIYQISLEENEKQFLIRRIMNFHRELVPEIRRRVLANESFRQKYTGQAAHRIDQYLQREDYQQPLEEMQEVIYDHVKSDMRVINEHCYARFGQFTPGTTEEDKESILDSYKTDLEEDLSDFSDYDFEKLKGMRVERKGRVTELNTSGEEVEWLRFIVAPVLKGKATPIDMHIAERIVMEHLSTQMPAISIQLFSEFDQDSQKMFHDDARALLIPSRQGLQLMIPQSGKDSRLNFLADSMSSLAEASKAADAKKRGIS